MKFNKLFFAALSFAALTMISCEKKPEPVPVTPGTEEEEAPECPSIAAPAAGQTTIAIYAEVCPKGAYLVGSNQGYNINDDALAFEAVPNAENWYAITVDFAADLQVKAIARPSDEDVPFSWSYQWGPNFDPDAAEPLVDDEAKNNTKILQGDGEFVLENQGEVKLANVADGGVVYVWVKNWKTSPVIEAKKLETCWAKTNWDQASDWTWREMTKVGDGVFEIEGVWGGNGFNIAETEGGADAWYPTDHANFTLDPEAAAGDVVKVTFTSEKGNVGSIKLDLVSKGQPKPDVPGGNGTFYVTIANREYTDGDVCIFTGNFEEKGWGDSDRAMTYDAGTGKWSWTGDYPVNFEYKVIYNDSWASGNNVVFDGENFEATFEIQ